ncbi:hypothetical protein [Dinghuibacter silviterrae]|uniref:Phosphoribosylpyrophosphate synthetase n=1 Tax=Dinghuibacter silviterrae TaxID=1539049 RepID=A0A4R8DS91_9BACT|nr:hypothetical protein [Dinghuibacter silviterrae]TDX01070.1 hypothetical protein EDB95_2101 [Dinghuibacter silviterrae]
MSPATTDMVTLSQVMAQLHEKGWDHEFHHAPKGFFLKEKHFYAPDELEIIKTYRFEGASNPSDSSVLYIICTREGRVGYVIDAYGIYSNHEDDITFDDFIHRIPVRNRPEQIVE